MKIEKFSVFNIIKTTSLISAYIIYIIPEICYERSGAVTSHFPTLLYTYCCITVTCRSLFLNSFIININSNSNKLNAITKIDCI